MGGSHYTSQLLTKIHSNQVEARTLPKRYLKGRCIIWPSKKMSLFNLKALRTRLEGERQRGCKDAIQRAARWSEKWKLNSTCYFWACCDTEADWAGVASPRPQSALNLSDFQSNRILRISAQPVKLVMTVLVFCIIYWSLYKAETSCHNWLYYALKVPLCNPYRLTRVNIRYIENNLCDNLLFSSFWDNIYWDEAFHTYFQVLIVVYTAIYKVGEIKRNQRVINHNGKRNPIRGG